MKRILTFSAILIIATVFLLGCGSTDLEKASKDCLYSEIEAACTYVKALKGQQHTNEEISSKEREIEALEEEIKILEEEIKILKEELALEEDEIQLLKEAWLASAATEGE